MVSLVKAVREHSFIGDDDKEVKGMYFYLQVIQADGRQDNRRVFVGEDRLADFAYIPKTGDRVLVYANNGKIVDMLKEK